MVGADAMGGKHLQMVREGGDMRRAEAGMMGDQQRVGAMGTHGRNRLIGGHFQPLVRAIERGTDTFHNIGRDIMADNQAWLHHRVPLPRL